MGERYLELHSEFRDRWIIFHMADGSTRDSRLVNWRRVKWKLVVALEVYIRGQRTGVDCDHLGFKFFLFFKIQQYETVQSGSRFEVVDRRFWVVGWTNGETAFLTRIDFSTGKVDKQYRQPLKSLAGHIHPDVRDTVAGNVPGSYSARELGYG